MQMFPSPSRSSGLSSSTSPSRSSSRGIRMLRLELEVIRVVEEVIAPVHVDHRDHVEGVAVDELRYLLVLSVPGEQAVRAGTGRPRRPGSRCRGCCVHVDAGLVVRRPGLRVVYRHRPDVAPLLALADHLEGGQRGIGVVQGLERLADLLVGVVVVESQRDGDGVVTPSRARFAGGWPSRRRSAAWACPAAPGASEASTSARAPQSIQSLSSHTSLPGASVTWVVSPQAFGDSSVT